MAQDHDQWVRNLARIRAHCDALQQEEPAAGTWSLVQRDRQDLLDIVDMLAAQLAVANARVMVLKTAQLVAAEQTQRVAMDQARRCTCGHTRDSHEHYRSGMDCSLCDCHQYRRAAA